MTKEEIQAKIDILQDCILSLSIDSYPNSALYDEWYEKLKKLQVELIGTKSIKDLQKEAFIAARLNVRDPNFDLDEDDSLYIPVYDNYEDYLSTLNIKLKL